MHGRHKLPHPYPLASIPGPYPPENTIPRLLTGLYITQRENDIKTIKQREGYLIESYEMGFGRSRRKKVFGQSDPPKIPNKANRDLTNKLNSFNPAPNYNVIIAMNISIFKNERIYSRAVTQLFSNTEFEIISKY